jgi:hypothetical protein
MYGAAGARPTRWFSQVDTSAPGLAHGYRWSGRLLRWGSELAGVPMPLPETVLLADPAPIGGVGPLDPGALVDAFLAALAGDGAERVRALLWRHGGMLRVERARPRLAPAGKVLHLDQERTRGPE